ncbi:ATP-grasp domain-containing protein [Aquibacillus sediminis]|uniref:ATP-grasp domain-containing protein n=1 Tax=Aquibacillus sediminis TaxID=2574734 RepID=UPI001107FAB5|nr:RimK family alpha-L-glutamate ligase [Aquibacillus sediminis]
MVKKAWVIYNGHLLSNKFLEFAEWIKHAASRHEIDTRIIKNNNLLSYLSAEQNTVLTQLNGERPDFVVFADKDIQLARQIEAMGIPVFNSSQTIDICDNKISTYQQLAKQQLPIPKSIISPKIFPGVDEIDLASFQNVNDYLDFPVVIKEAYGSYGEQVYLVKTQADLLEKISLLKDRPFVIQEFIESSYGKDIRLNVVGDRVVAAMLRYEENDFRSNLASGKSRAYQPTEQEKQLAIAATKAVGADFAGIDLLLGEKGPIVCEVNSNALVHKTYHCTGVDVTQHIIDYIVKKGLYK